MSTILDQTRKSWFCIGHVSDFKHAGPFTASADGFDLVILETPTGWKVYQGRCPHQGALLGEGEFDGATLTCRNHGWRFDASSGQRHGGPQCLIECDVEIRDAALWADIGPLKHLQGTGRKARRTLDDLPGPRPLPLVGNLFQLNLNRLHLVLESWAQQYGPIYTYRLGPKRVIGIADASLSEEILRDRPEAYRRASIVEPVFIEMGVAGVFSAEGIAWRPQRRLAMHALSQRQQREFYASMRTIAQRLAKRWQKFAESGEIVDVVAEMKRFTVDVTTLLVFGYDVNTIERGTDGIQKNLELVFPTLNRRLFALLPTWRLLRMPSDRRVDRALAELRAWLSVRIGEARRRLANDPARVDNPENFIEAMLTARDADGQPFPDDVIFGNAMTMLLAGEDTTALTLAWAIHHLCDAPNVVERLFEESARVVDADKLPPDIDAALGLVYAGGVANEAMRLRPVAPILFLENNSDVVVDDIAVPAGTWLALLMRPPAVSEHHFDAPNEFKPERWLPANQSGPHEPGAHMPFGSGPRICPGRSLAFLEMKLVLSMLYSRFDIERVGTGVTEEFAFTMGPAGLGVRVRERK